jgi:DNA replication protein DnaC
MCEDTGYAGPEMCGCLSALLREYAVERLNRLGSGGGAPSGGTRRLPLCRFGDFSPDVYPAARDESGVSPRERMTHVLAYCRRYVEDFTPMSESLLLRGPTGTGKTFLSLCIAREVTQTGFQVVYGPLQLLLHRLEGEHFGREDAGSLDTMTGCDLLILDDLGVEFATPFYTSCLYTLLNTRQLAGLPTIVSTNLGPKQLLDRYGDPIASRIVGGFVPLLFAGSDVRLVKRGGKM